MVATGQEPTLPPDLQNDACASPSLDDPTDYVDVLKQRLSLTHQQMTAPPPPASANPYQEGSLIFVMTTPPERTNKLTPRWKGPFRVKRVPNPYQVVYEDGSAWRTIHVNHAKPAKLMAPDLPLPTPAPEPPRPALGYLPRSLQRPCSRPPPPPQAAAPTGGTSPPPTASVPTPPAPHPPASERPTSGAPSANRNWLTQPPISATNQNSGISSHQDHSEIWGLYKPAQTDPRQDLTATHSRVNTSGFGLSSPALQQPSTKPYSGLPSRRLMTSPNREAGDADGERPGIVYPLLTSAAHPDTRLMIDAALPEAAVLDRRSRPPTVLEIPDSQSQGPRRRQSHKCRRNRSMGVYRPSKRSPPRGHWCD